MKNRLIVALMTVGVAAVIFSPEVVRGEETRDALYKELEIFAEGLAVIEDEYVDQESPQDLVYGAMRGMLVSLDSYSQFLTPEDYKNLLVETEGKFGGLGIEITLKDGLLTIITPLEDTPAWKAGIKAGDIIVKIDGELTKEITLNEAVKKLRGKPGTEVTITVWREKEREVKDITITRDVIKIQDIKRALILEDGIGCIKIAEFRETTARDLDKALEKLNQQGLNALIIDVRNNPGGLLNSAIDIASRFLADGKTIVSTQSRSEAESTYKSLPFGHKYLKIPIVVLINKGSASGSEIVASALRENKRAILLGETTFGKGSVQTILPLSDGSALRLTTSKYYTPGGVSIHEKGVEPDIEVTDNNPDKTVTDVFEELDRKKDYDYRQDYQMLRALDLIKGLLVLNNRDEG